MKNLLSREEFLNQLDEGFIRDTFRKGINAIKKVFSIGIKKIKNFIVSFDTNGNVLPVVSLQATIDHFAGNKNVQVFAPKEISDSVVAAGGKGCSSYAVYVGDDDDTESTDGPSGKEWAKWMKEKQFEKTIEYQNFKRIPKIIKEHYSCTDEEADKIFERVFYSNKHQDDERTTGVSKFAQLTTDTFTKELNRRIRFKQAKKKLVKGNKVQQDPGNMLVFGAPGIGKSTIPKQVIKAYNKGKQAFEKMALISVNCANINPGDLLMPNIPKDKDLMGILNQHKDDFPQFAFVNKLDNDAKEKLANQLENSGQTVAPESPKSWLPCYHRTGDKDLDAVLRLIADGGIMEKEITTKNEFTGEITTEEINEMTGSGGIILFDEFLRAQPMIFNELMNFLLEGHVGDWYLGPKWIIIACSNRPCDDKTTHDTWGEFGNAAKDRWHKIYHMEPDPESWKKWARSKGMEEIILKFIFDENSKDYDEYTRWHRMDGFEEQGDEDSGKPVTPRTWEKAWIDICNYELENELDSILEIPLDELKEIVSGTFDNDFVQEFINWIEQHTGNVDLEQIIKDPENTFPTKNKDTDDTVIFDNLWEQIEKKYTKQQDIPDKELANIFCWLGMNFPNDANLVFNIIQNLDKILPNGKDNPNRWSTKKKSNLMLNAAWPTLDSVDELYENTEIESKEKDETQRKNKILEKMKEFMNEYFPWRIEGDKIKYVDEIVDDSLE